MKRTFKLAGLFAAAALALAWPLAVNSDSGVSDATMQVSSDYSVVSGSSLAGIDDYFSVTNIGSKPGCIGTVIEAGNVHNNAGPSDAVTFVDWIWGSRASKDPAKCGDALVDATLIA